jgi:hypothetical protein
MRDLVWKARKDVPQGLKPSYAEAMYGTAKPVPFAESFSAACKVVP